MVFGGNLTKAFMPILSTPSGITMFFPTTLLVAFINNFPSPEYKIPSINLTASQSSSTINFRTLKLEDVLDVYANIKK